MKVFFISVILLNLFNNCLRPRKKNSSQKIAVQSLTLQVFGVECKQCAEDVGNILKKIPGIIDIQHSVSTDDDYETSYFVIMYNKNQALEQNIRSCLAQEGYKKVLVQA